VRYLLPAPVVDYIERNGLYLEEGSNAGAGAGTSDKEREREAGSSKRT
jgi:nicotinamide mononucleotide adenylyltransferase